MLKKIVSLALAGSLMAAASARPVSAVTLTKAEKEARFAEKVKAGITKLGTGTEARVEVKLRDKTKVKGYVSAADSADSFTVTDPKTGASRTIAYSDVDKVNKPGGGLSTRGWVILGAAATAAVVVGVTVLYPVLCDGGAGC